MRIRDKLPRLHTRITRRQCHRLIRLRHIHHKDAAPRLVRWLGKWTGDHKFLLIRQTLNIRHVPGEHLLPRVLLPLPTVGPRLQIDEHIVCIMPRHRWPRTTHQPQARKNQQKHAANARIA
jgi:hypothetical protein